MNVTLTSSIAGRIGQLVPIALDYAARGFAVFPCLEKSKAPACGRGFRDATINPATIRRWFGSSFHQYNIAISTGVVSALFVLDIDGPAGAIALAKLEHKFGQLPRTLASITASGCHLWFRIADPLPSSAGRIGDGLDGRGCGGYVLAPPSIHPDGPVYRWSNDEAPVPIPDWLAQLARRTLPTPPPPTRPLPPHPCLAPSAASRYAQAALEDECHAVATAPVGTRNNTLNRASFSLHQLVAGGELDQGEVRQGLMDAATACGLMSDSKDAVEKTIASGARAGLQFPRRRPI